MSKWILIIAILVTFGLFGWMSYTHRQDMKEMQRKYEDEIETLNLKHKAIVDGIIKEHDRIENLYAQRTKEVKQFQQQQEKILDDNKRLEKLIQSKPKMVEKILNKSFDNYMEEVYNATHSNNDDRN